MKIVKYIIEKITCAILFFILIFLSNFSDALYFKLVQIFLINNNLDDKNLNTIQIDKETKIIIGVFKIQSFSLNFVINSENNIFRNNNNKISNPKSILL